MSEKQAFWIRTENGMKNKYIERKCSNCGFIAPDSFLYKKCDKCGAFMDLGETDMPKQLLTEKQIKSAEAVLTKGDRVELIPVKDGVRVIRVKREEVKNA